MTTKQIDIATSVFEKNSPDLMCASSLGACVGLAIYDEMTKVGGMVVFMLPDASIIPVTDNDYNPYLFANTGIPKFFDQAQDLGISLSRAKIAVAGGAGLLDTIGPYSVGKRNCECVVSHLSQMNIDDRVIMDLGGSQNRSMKLNLATGEISIEVWGEQVKKI